LVCWPPLPTPLGTPVPSRSAALLRSGRDATRNRPRPAAFGTTLVPFGAHQYRLIVDPRPAELPCGCRPMRWNCLGSGCTGLALHCGATITTAKIPEAPGTPRGNARAARGKGGQLLAVSGTQASQRAACGRLVCRRGLGAGAGHRATGFLRRPAGLGGALVHHGRGDRLPVLARVRVVLRVHPEW